MLQAVDAALQQIDGTASELLSDDQTLITLGGDHTVALGALRAAVGVHGPVALVHYDAHLDTWDSCFGADRTHGTVFRRAFEEGLLLPDASVHVGIRGPLYDRSDLDDDARFGFSVVRAADFDDLGAAEVIGRVSERVGDAPVYLSVDVDVLDPASAPGTGTGTPEMGGFTSRELLLLLRGMPGEQLVAADVVEVSPAYDTAEVTSLAGTTVAYEVMALMAAARVRPSGAARPPR